MKKEQKMKIIIEGFTQRFADHDQNVYEDLQEYLNSLNKKDRELFLKLIEEFREEVRVQDRLFKNQKYDN